MLIDIITLLALVIAGFITGIAAGIFSIGGGTVLIPLLLTLFAKLGFPQTIDMHIAIATSLALIIPTAISSSTTHYRNQNLDFGIAKQWIPGICIGTLLGIFLVHICSSFWLKLFFSGYLLFCIIYSFVKKEPSESQAWQQKQRTLFPISTLVGCFSAMLGIGGGTFTTPILSFLNYPIKKALAISAFTGLFIGSIGAVTIAVSSLTIPNLPPFSIGYINWLVFILIAPTAIIGSALGVNIANKQSKQTIQKTYTLFLSVIFLLMLYHTFV